MANGPPPSRAVPYNWESETKPPNDVLHLWTQVGENIEKHQTGMSVIPEKAVMSSLLSLAFCETVMPFLVPILAWRSKLI